jgi:hypothetical protein
MNYSEAFAAYGAKLANPMWAFSAKALDGSILFSCWSHKFGRPHNGVVRYTDRLSRWSRINTAGKNLFVAHLSEAYDQRLTIRLIIAKTTAPEVVDSGEDASAIPKTFHVRPDLVGRVAEFDGDGYTFEFRRSTAAYPAFERTRPEAASFVAKRRWRRAAQLGR